MVRPVAFRFRFRVGVAFGAVTILSHFTTFMSILGVVFAPVAGIVIVEYCLVKTWRSDLSGSEGMPASAPR